MSANKADINAEAASYVIAIERVGTCIFDS